MALVSHWPLEGNAKDVVGPFDGYEVGSVSYSSGVLGDCYDNTAGNSTGIELMKHADAKKFDKGNYSFSLWFKSTTTSGGTVRRIFARDDSEYITATIDQNQTGQQDLESDTNGASAQVNEWHHLALVHKPSFNLEVWLDGQYVTTNNVPHRAAIRPYVIGGNTEGDGDISGGHFVGKIDDVRLYDHALSTHEIKELSRAKNGHWVFPDGNILDKSAQSNGGTMIDNASSADVSVVGSPALDLDGSGDEAQSSNQTPSGDPPLTLVAWGKSRTTSPNDWTGLISVASSNSTNTTLTINYDGGSNNMTLHTWGNSTAGYALDTNWHHYAAVNTGNSEQKFFVDGQLIGSMTQTLSLPGGKTFLGTRDGSGRHWNGWISDPRVYHSALTQSEIQDLYQAKARISDNHRLFTHNLNEGAFEGFRDGALGPDWNTPNVYVKSDTAYYGNYSIGSSGQGSVDADWTPAVLGGGRQIDSFSYWWWETTGQSGHEVRLYDSNGNKVQQSETENPQWQMSDGSGSMNTIRGYESNRYQNWTLFRMVFDWDAGTYDYFAKNSTGQTRSGSYGLINATDVAKISLVGTSGNHCRFDGFKINDEDVSKRGIVSGSGLSEVGPAADSLVGWWDFDREDNRNKAAAVDGSGSAGYVKGYGNGKAYDANTSSINCGNYSSLQNAFTGEGITIAYWWRQNTNSSSWNDQINKGSHRVEHGSDNYDGEDDGPGYLARLYDGNGSYTQVANNNISGIARGEWFHFVLRKDRDGVTAWVNGKVDQTNNANFTLGGYSADDFVIGKHSVDDYMDDVRVYDRALTAEEVSILYEMSGPDPKLKMTSEGIYAPAVSETRL